MKLSPQSPPHDDFYTELDTYVRGSGWCTVPALTWLSVLILLLGIFCIVVFVQPGSAIQIHGRTVISKPLFTFPHASSPDPGAVILDAHITDSELTELLRQMNPAGVGPLQAHIHTEAIQLDGTTSGRYTLPVYVAFRPEVNDQNSIVIVLTDAQISHIRLMPIIKQSMRDALSKQLEAFVDAQVHGKIVAIVLHQGELTAHVAVGK